MILGKVVGTIVTTISHPHYKNRRLLVVQPLVMEGDTPEPNEDFIALDNTQAGIGDTVLVNREGNDIRHAHHQGMGRKPRVDPLPPRHMQSCRYPVLDIL